MQCVMGGIRLLVNQREKEPKNPPDPPGSTDGVIYTKMQHPLVQTLCFKELMISLPRFHLLWAEPSILKATWMIGCRSPYKTAEKLVP